MNHTELIKRFIDVAGDVEFSSITGSSHYAKCMRWFTNGYALGHVINDTSTPLVPDKGIILSSGNPEDFNGNDGDSVSTSFNIGTTDLDLRSITTAQVQDPCFLQFKFRCTSNAYVPTVSFRYVFGSEEYYEYVDSAFNDAFAFFLNKKNIATIPDTETDLKNVTINNVNYYKNSKYFHGNDPAQVCCSGKILRFALVHVVECVEN